MWTLEGWITNPFRVLKASRCGTLCVHQEDQLKFNPSWAADSKLIENKVGKSLQLDCEEISHLCQTVPVSPVQVISLHVIVLEHSQQLHVLTGEAGRQQAVDPHLETLLQGESHALQTHRHKINTQSKSTVCHHNNTHITFRLGETTDCDSQTIWYSKHTGMQKSVLLSSQYLTLR